MSKNYFRYVFFNLQKICCVFQGENWNHTSFTTNKQFEAALEALRFPPGPKNNNFSLILVEIKKVCTFVRI